MGLIVKYFCHRKENSLVFYTPTGEFEITSYIKQINTLLVNCNGIKKFTEIIDECTDFKDIATQLLNFLIEKNIVVEIKNWIKSDYSLTSYPDLEPAKEYDTSNNNTLTIPTTNQRVSVKEPIQGALHFLFKNRESTHDFVNEAVPLSKINSVLWSMSKHQVPSTGRYYPYNIVLCNHLSTNDLELGWYQFIEEKHSLIKLDLDYDYESCVRIHDDAYILTNSTCTIYLITQLDSHCNKYTNRGIKFVFAEGGSLIQNAYLTAANENIGICALGGFDERFLIDYLNLESKWVVPFSLVIGSPSSEQNYTQSIQELNDKLVKLSSTLEDNGFLKNSQDYVWNENDPTNTLISTTTQFTKDGHIDSGFGTSNTRLLAKLKSLVEVYERVVSSEPEFDVQATANELPCFIDPETTIPRNIDYVNKHNLYKFKTNDKNLWCKGSNYYETKNTYALVDTLYYPANHGYLNREPFIYGNSSGTCGHYDPQLAMQGAFYELLERDALMVMWYSKKAVFELESNSLPFTIAKKIKSYEKLGVTAKILDISIDIPTYLTIFLNENEQPHFTSGASSNLTSDQALKKSFEEAEFNYLSWYKFGKFKEINIDEILEPFHHHLYYCNKNNWTNLDWLFKADTIQYSPNTSDLESLLNIYDPWFFHLQNEMIPELYIYKCLCTKLAPIHFGFPVQFDIIKRLADLEIKLDITNSSLPHFFS